MCLKADNISIHNIWFRSNKLCFRENIVQKLFLKYRGIVSYRCFRGCELHFLVMRHTIRNMK